MPSPKQEIEQLLRDRLGDVDPVSAVRTACNLLLAEVGISNPPVKLSLIARYLGAKIEYHDDGQIGKEEASIKLSNGALVLWVSRKRFENSSTRMRARFSIAHEIGHLVLAKSIGLKIFDLAEADERAYKFTEKLCDVAASHILIPRLFLLEALRQRDFTSAGVRALTNLFEVSEHALLNSLGDLMPGGLVIELRKYRRTDLESLTWRVWQSYSSSDREVEGWLPVGCTLRHLPGVIGIDRVAIDHPESRREISLVRGRARVSRDSVICRWPLAASAQQLSLAGPSPKQRGLPLKIDCSAGRLMIFVAKRDRLDLGLFGVGQERCESTSLAH